MIEVNGKLYSKEQVEQVKVIILELYEKVKEAVLNISDALAEVCKKFIQKLMDKGYSKEQAINYLKCVMQLE